MTNTNGIPNNEIETNDSNEAPILNDHLNPVPEKESTPLSTQVFAGIEQEMSKYPDLAEKNEVLMMGLVEKFPHAFHVVTLSNGERVAVLEFDDILKAEVHKSTVERGNNGQSQNDKIIERMNERTTYVFSKD